MIDQHHNYMQQALQLAEQGRYTVSPNPMVGCVLVKAGEIVGIGYHVYAGGAHAEIVALAAAGEKAKGAIAYVSLEPCCHQGRTPPCTAALQAAGVTTVYAATLDPNPLVAGKGLAALEAAGIQTYHGLCQAEAQQLNEIFFYYMRHRLPFVIAKWAMSLDGKTITHQLDDRKITQLSSIAAVHATRQQMDAILIGAHTARQDNPLLTVRHTPKAAAFVKHPLRIVLSSDANLPLHLHLFDKQLPGKTLVVTTDKASFSHCNHLRAKQIEVITLPANNKQQISLTDLLSYLGERGITSLLIEGGATTHAAFFAEKCVNKIEAYVAPVIIGTTINKQPVSVAQTKQIGNDYLFTAYYEE